MRSVLAAMLAIPIFAAGAANALPIQYQPPLVSDVNVQHGFEGNALSRFTAPIYFRFTIDSTLRAGDAGFSYPSLGFTIVSLQDGVPVTGYASSLFVTEGLFADDSGLPQNATVFETLWRQDPASGLAIHFPRLAVGDYTLVIAGSYGGGLLDSSFGFLLGMSGIGEPSTIQNVPEPSPLILLLAGTIALITIRHQRRKNV